MMQPRMAATGTGGGKTAAYGEERGHMVAHERGGDEEKH